MRFMKQVRWLVVVLSVVLMVAGCSKPPEAEQKAGKAAMDASMSAGADKYAAADFGAATKKWDAAEAQMKDKKYKEAKEAYVEAKAAFEKAAKGVEAGKKAVADEVNAALAGIEEAWKSVEASAKKVEKKMKDQKDAWAADAKAIGEGMAKVKEMVAVDPAGAKAKFGEVKALVEKWGNAIKDMAAAPAKPEPPKKETKEKKK
jgi:hypothetical protein